MILNLDKSFTPYGENEIAYDAFTFAGGEPHIKFKDHVDDAGRVLITHRINAFNDIGLLCVATDALRRMGVKHIEAFIPYFPAARQDRVMVKGEPLTVKVYSTIINSLAFDKVTVFDAHSEVTPAVLNHCDVITNHTFIKKIAEDLSTNSILISPDGGALKKIFKVSQYLGGQPVVECSKSRDVKTGSLSGFKVYTDTLNHADCLIVDDICDGGATFIGLAEALKDKQAGNLFLAVSHGIFSKGVENLANIFNTIYTTDSIKEITHPNVKQIRFADGLLS